MDYSATPEEVQNHFQSCGTINRVTILCDKWTGHPKGYYCVCPSTTSIIIYIFIISTYKNKLIPNSFAYVEFADAAAVPSALVLTDSLFKGRIIKVVAKRTNAPGMKRGGFRGGRGGFRSRGGFRGGRGSYRYVSVLAQEIRFCLLTEIYYILRNID